MNLGGGPRLIHFSASSLLARRQKRYNMLRVGRPRKTHKDLPIGVFVKKGRYYVTPVNAEMRRVFAFAYPGKSTAPLGADKHQARAAWVKLFVTDLPKDDDAAGTVGELVGRYERDVLPHLHPKTRVEHARYCKNLRDAIGARRYAKSEAQAGSGDFLRSMDVTRYIGAQAASGRPVAGNKEMRCLSRIFRIAKTRWGYTEYNPCLQVEYNPEQAREVYVSDGMFMRIYEKATPSVQCMMDIAQMTGARRGMILALDIADIADEGLWITVNKRKRGAGVKRKLNAWSPELRAVVDRALALRSKVRGSGRPIEHPAAARPLFLTRRGIAYSDTAFNSLWRRARERSGFGKHEFHFHDIKAKAISESASLEEGMKRGDHIEPRTTRRVYQRKPDVVTPLPSVSAGAKKTA
jgi:integrase